MVGFDDMQPQLPGRIDQNDKIFKFKTRVIGVALLTIQMSMASLKSLAWIYAFIVGLYLFIIISVITTSFFFYILGKL